MDFWNAVPPEPFLEAVAGQIRAGILLPNSTSPQTVQFRLLEYRKGALGPKTGWEGCLL